VTVPIVDWLPLDIPPASEQRVWLRLVDDALGLGVRAPVLVARGAEDGPTLGLCAAVHGDEVNGIPIIHSVFRRLDPHKLRGTVIGVPVINVPAFHDHSRRTPHGFDLNHHFPGCADGNDIEVYAHRLMERFVARLDLLIDLHTASRGRANCLYVRADMKTESTARMAYLQRPQIILHNPPSDGTLRGAAHERGVPAVTVEVGNPSRFQRDLIRRSVVGVRSVLVEHGMVSRRPVDPGEPPVLCKSSHWMYTDRGGLLEVFPKVTERVEAGQPIARLVDAFGDELVTYTAPHDGVIIGRAVDPVAAAGSRIVHLGVLASSNDGFVDRDGV
jgi:predicted deacylase